MKIKKERRSFLKKKNQKTFIPGGDTQNSGLNDTFGAKCKSFLLLFFKKEDFLPLIAFCLPGQLQKQEAKNFYVFGARWFKDPL